MRSVSLGVIAAIFWTGVFCQTSPHKSYPDQQQLTLIEQIQTLEDVDSFLSKYVDSFYDIKMIPVIPTSAFRIKLKGIQDYFVDSLGISSYLKEDFDKDGRTDLLINAIWRLRPSGFVILDKGNGVYELKTFIDNQRNRMNMVFIKPGSIEGNPCINYFLMDMNRLVDSLLLKDLKDEYITGFLSEKNLVYTFNEFIEYNRKPSPLSFQKIDYQRGGIFEDYIHYSLQIHNDRKIYLRVEGENKYWKDAKTFGTYSCVLTPKEFKKLKELTGYINLSGLKNKYDVERADVPWVDIKLSREKYKTVLILDRGLSGTFGLQALHQYFEKLYKSLNWKQENEPIIWLN